MNDSITFEFANNVPWKKQYQLKRDGAVFPLTGAALYMQFRETPASDEVVLDLSTENGRLIIANAGQGIWAFNVSIVEALQIPAGQFVHDMVVFPATGDPFGPFTGTAIISAGITRSVAKWQPLS